MENMILIVEDLSFTRRMLRDILEHAGYHRILEAADGAGALKLYREEKPELVLLDITLPDCKDLGVLAQLRTIDPNAKVIICSAANQPALIEQAKRMGAVDYFLKPVDAEKLITTAQQVFMEKQEQFRKNYSDMEGLN